MLPSTKSTPPDCGPCKCVIRIDLFHASKQPRYFRSESGVSAGKNRMWPLGKIVVGIGTIGHEETLPL